MKPPAVVDTATRQARDRALDRPDARKIEKTIRAFVNEPPRPCSSGEGEIVAALFVGNAQVVAGRPPFLSVWQDALPANPELGEKMCEFVTQRSIDLSQTMFAQTRIQRNEFPTIIGAARARFQTRAPFHANFIGDTRGAGRDQECARFTGKIDIL